MLLDDAKWRQRSWSWEALGKSTTQNSELRIEGEGAHAVRSQWRRGAGTNTGTDGTDLATNAVCCCLIVNLPVEISNCLGLRSKFRGKHSTDEVMQTEKSLCFGG